MGALKPDPGQTDCTGGFLEARRIGLCVQSFRNPTLTGERDMKRTILAVIFLTLQGCTSITYNCNAAASCTPAAKPASAGASDAASK